MVKQVGTDRNEVKFWMVLTRKITYKDSIFKIIKKVWADSRFTLRNMSLIASMATLDLHPLFDNTVSQCTRHFEPIKATINARSMM